MDYLVCSLSLHILCVFLVLWSVYYVFPARLSVNMRKNMRTAGLIFVKFDTGKVLKELSVHFSFHLDWTILTITFAWKTYMLFCTHLKLNIYHIEKSFDKKKVVEKNEHILCPAQFLCLTAFRMTKQIGCYAFIFKFESSLFNDHHGLLVTLKTWTVCVILFFVPLFFFISTNNWKYCILCKWKFDAAPLAYICCNLVSRWRVLR
jgi:hypothetical protein